MRLSFFSKGQTWAWPGIRNFLLLQESGGHGNLNDLTKDHTIIRQTDCSLQASDYWTSYMCILYICVYRCMQYIAGATLGSSQDAERDGSWFLERQGKRFRKRQNQLQAKGHSTICWRHNENHRSVHLSSIFDILACFSFSKQSYCCLSQKKKTVNSAWQDHAVDQYCWNNMPKWQTSNILSLLSYSVFLIPMSYSWHTRYQDDAYCQKLYLQIPMIGFYWSLNKHHEHNILTTFQYRDAQYSLQAALLFWSSEVYQPKLSYQHFS